MTIAPGYVFELDVAHSDVGPWSAGRHPGLILAVSSSAVTLVPMSSSPPRGHDRGYGYEVTDGGVAVNTPIWVHCHIVVTLASSRLQGLTTRGRLPKEQLGPIRDRVAAYLKLAI